MAFSSVRLSEAINPFLWARYKLSHKKVRCRMAVKGIYYCYSFSLDVQTHNVYRRASLLSKTNMEWQVAENVNIDAAAICEKHRECWSVNRNYFVVLKLKNLVLCKIVQSLFGEVAFRSQSSIQ